MADHYVISVVDSVPRPWPAVEELARLGVPEELQLEWQWFRWRMSEHTLENIVRASRN